MPSPVLTLTNKTYDAALTNLTTMTGGLGTTIGYTGADWLNLNNATQWLTSWTRFRKINGGHQINPYLVTAGANPTPTLSNGSQPAGPHNFAITAGDMDESGGVAFATNGSMAVNVADTELGNGIGVSFPLTRKLQTFWWLGNVRNGAHVVDATVSDGLVTVAQLALPVGGFNVLQYAWFECTFRGTDAQVAADETVDIEITRLSSPGGAAGQVNWRASLLLTPVNPPKPRGMPAGRR
jgi:hypothetical protein